MVMFVAVSCATEKKNTEESGGDSGEVSADAPKVVILTNAGYGDEPFATVIQDQLQKAGFAPEISLQPDYASWRTQVDAGNFDLAITYWNTVTGSPDYAVRSVWHSEGPLNLYGIKDEKLDELIETGATQTPEEYMETYSKFEDYLVEDQAYVIPIYVSIKDVAINMDIMDPNSVRISKSRSMVWEELRFSDASKQDSDPFIMSQTASDLTPLDPIRSDDGSTFMLNTNCYIRLMNLTDDDKVTTDSTLSRAYAISESGSEFYFLLRDDVTFSAVKDGHAVDMGERVGAEDAVYSLDRMKDEKSVPDHKNFNNFTAVDSNEIVTDIEPLKEIPSKTGGKSVYDLLSESAGGEIKSLTDDKTKADNANGVYQVVKLTTKYAFPQILNVLAHSSGGIVSKSQIEKINAKYIENPASYDVEKDFLYGEQSCYTEGDGYDNSLVCSGPYIPIKKNDLEVIFEKNPGYMPGDSKFAPAIKTVQMKFIEDSETQFSALRSGDIYVMHMIPTAKIDIIKEDPQFEFKEISGNAFNYLAFNFNGEFADINLRKAALYAIDQEQLSAVFNHRKLPTYAPVTPVLSTGKELKADPKLSAEYLKKWADAQSK
jgi:peptide/nickel transport system substrate-binding protein